MDMDPASLQADVCCGNLHLKKETKKNILEVIAFPFMAHVHHSPPVDRHDVRRKTTKWHSNTSIAFSL
jgi:hypothetical protein